MHVRNLQPRAEHCTTKFLSLVRMMAIKNGDYKINKHLLWKIAKFRKV